MNHLVMGEKYRDSMTGFEGTCAGICEYLYGCRQALIVPLLDKDGRKVDGEWIDEQRLVDAGSLRAVDPIASSGGPQDHPTGAPHPD